MDIDKICRCCLGLDMPLLSIYDAGSFGTGCVADMLKQISKLMPQRGDNMPEKACLQCISEINRCYVFKMKCENSNKTLRQLLPEAVPEPLDFVAKKIIEASSAVQTEDKSVITYPVQSLKEKEPLVNHVSVQTVEVKPFVSHTEVQTEYEVIKSCENKYKRHDEHLEDIFIYEGIENSSEKNEEEEEFMPESKPMSKRLRFESSKAVDIETKEESQINSQRTSAYILLEDSNCSAETEIYTQSTTDNQKYSEFDRYEYYENEEDEIEDDEQKNLIYQENEDSTENYKVSTVYEIDSSEGKTKSDEEAEAIIKHRNNKRKPKGQYKCSECIMTFVSTKVLKRHLAKMHDIKDDELIIDYVPDDPDEMPKRVDGPLYNSILELTSENVPKPQLMPREKPASLPSAEILTDVKYFCDNCQAGFAQRKTLTAHVKQRVCMTNNFKCNICESIFVSEENLETHKLTHENPHKCLECDTVCKTIEELSEHMISSHNRSARNQCHVCKKVFTMKTSLNDHLRIHSGEKPFLCTICGKSFRQNSNLRQHLIRHTNEKNFKCDNCPNAYVTKAELFSHKRTHTGDHPFKCDICQARFTTSCSLKKHVRKHTGERPYACEFCSKRFAALNVLKNHRRIHTGEKPFQCAHCPKKFTQKGDCLMHERTHISNDFKCFCDTKFSKKSNLTYHIKTHHPNYNEKELQDMLDKTIHYNDEAEYHIIKSTNNENDNEHFVAISHEKTSSNDNGDELVEIVFQDAIE